MSMTPTSPAHALAPSSGSDSDSRVRRVHLSLRSLEAGYAGNTIVGSVSAEVAAGECWAVIGPNGAGKTTLLRTLLGLLPPIAGTVERSALTGYVAQRHRVQARAAGSARDVVRSAADRGWSFLGRRADVQAQVTAAMSRAGCDRFAHARYTSLSEGQRQRVLIARALVGGAELLVLDEPTSAMDPDASREIAELLRSFRGNSGVAVLVVTHDMSLVQQVATHVLVVDRSLSRPVAGPRAEVAQHTSLSALHAHALAEHPSPLSGVPASASCDAGSGRDA